MIELSLGMINDISYILHAEDDQMHTEFENKYNISLTELTDIIDEYTDDSYINNNIYHIVPIVTLSSIFFQLCLMYFNQ